MALDPRFPAKLRDPRLALTRLHASGPIEWLARPMLAIVGSRNAPDAACEFSARLARAASSMGIVVVSGGARGIDEAAHRGASETVMVLGSSMEAVSPRSTCRLIETLGARCLLLSEYDAQEPVRAWRFLERNRIVVALADAVIVVAAREKSGALSSARWARTLRKPLWTVVGAPWDEHFAGSRTLLAEGATCITSFGDFRTQLRTVFGVELDAIESRPAFRGDLHAWAKRLGMGRGEALVWLEKQVMSGKLRWHAGGIYSDGQGDRDSDRAPGDV